MMVIRWTARRLSPILIVILGLILALPAVAAGGPAPPAIRADAVVLMDLRNGRILYAKRPDAREYPASTTKIMTAVIALELGRLDDVVMAGDDVLKADGTRIYLEPGEQETLRDLLYAMLLNSANDAAVAVADHIAGDTRDFARLMNAVAAKLGATGTHFVNPHGLTDPNHYTTARDLALIARYAMHNPTFAAIVGTLSYAMPWPAKDGERHLYNQNRFLTRYPYATGVKPGYTSQAKDTLVASASKDGVDLLAVILRASGSGLWTDAARLMDYGFAIAPKAVEVPPIEPGLAVAAARELGIGIAGPTAAGPRPPTPGAGNAGQAAPGSTSPGQGREWSGRPALASIREGWRGVLEAGLPLVLTGLVMVWAARRPGRRGRRRKPPIRWVNRRFEAGGWVRARRGARR